jgi:hypothetical protein
MTDGSKVCCSVWAQSGARVHSFSSPINTSIPPCASICVNWVQGLQVKKTAADGRFIEAQMVGSMTVANLVGLIKIVQLVTLSGVTFLFQLR